MNGENIKDEGKTKKNKRKNWSFSVKFLLDIKKQWGQKNMRKEEDFVKI
jgi:hypothetical protein